MKKLFSLLAITILLTTLAACKKPQGASDEQIKTYILAHPEVIVEALKKYQQQQAEGDDKKLLEEISKNSDKIFNDPTSPIVGNPKGSKVMVEFFDYNCHYCKGVLPDIKRVMNTDNDVKIIFKELAILGPSSATTALAALVVHDVAPDKYFAFHTELMNHKGPADDNSIAEALKASGIDRALVEKKITDPKYQKILSENIELAHTLGIDGTPTFIINGKPIRGAARYENMKDALDNK